MNFNGTHRTMIVGNHIRIPKSALKMLSTKRLILADVSQFEMHFIGIFEQEEVLKKYIADRYPTVFIDGKLMGEIDQKNYSVVNVSKTNEINIGPYKDFFHDNEVVIIGNGQLFEIHNAKEIEELYNTPVEELFYRE